jgi:hypothetical protein
MIYKNGMAKTPGEFAKMARKGGALFFARFLTILFTVVD